MTLINYRHIFFIFIGISSWMCACQNNSMNISTQCTTGVYAIREVKDTSAWRRTTGFEFYCDSGTVIKRIDLVSDYPWKTDCYTILPYDNPYLNYGSADHYQSSIWQGFIPFQLDNARWKDIIKCFNLTSPLAIDSLYFKFASIDTRYFLVSSELLILSHYLKLFAGRDAVQTGQLEFYFPEGQLKVYNAKGDTIYSITRSNYGFQYPVVDTSHRYLCLKTFFQDEHNRKYGWEIHDIVKDTILFSLVGDSAFGFIEPKVFESYVVFEMQKEHRNPEGNVDGYFTHRTIVLDATQAKILKHDMKDDYSFSFDRMANDWFIYIRGNDETEPIEYDSVHISRFVPY